MREQSIGKGKTMVQFPGPPVVPPVLPTEMDENRPVKDPENSLFRRLFHFFARIIHRLFK